MVNAPISFKPIAMERVWGGRRFESLPGKALPPVVPIGEIWEVVDRESDQSIVQSGPLVGKSLHELWTQDRCSIFGVDFQFHPSPRFPILVKLLDASERLSVQVHPPAHLASDLGGEPKTEVWYFMEATKGASVYAGLRRNITREEFAMKLNCGDVESLLHEVPVRTGESIFIPSGRLHAIGEGNLIVEVQQNSDTTYRAFDWNRGGQDGQPRVLHIEQSLRSIDFADFEPAVAPIGTSVIADCPYFRVERIRVEGPFDPRPSGRFAMVTVVEGSVTCEDEVMPRGSVFLLPATDPRLLIGSCQPTTTVLVTTLPT